MTHKVRTYRGKIVDMDEIRQKNDRSISVGNMNVNARGDQLDEWGNIIKSRDQVTREKNSSMSRKTTNASVISTFEDDDDYELKDDPNVLMKNRKKTTRNQKTEEKATETVKTEDTADTSTDETDLD